MTYLSYGIYNILLIEAEVYFDDFIEQLGGKVLQRNADNGALLILLSPSTLTTRLISSSV
jgi:hypothetical protein